MGGLVGFNTNTNYHLVSLPFFSIEYFKIQSQLYFSCPSIDDVLIICKSIIPYNGADFYIIKFNTCPHSALTVPSVCSASISLAQSNPSVLRHNAKPMTQLAQRNESYHKQTSLSLVKLA